MIRNIKYLTLIHWLGLLGIVSLLSYTAAVVFSPLAYPGYKWMGQAVSDLSAENSPSQMLWNSYQLMFPLSDSGYAGTFQDVMHTYVVTVFVVLFSIISLIVIMIGGYCSKQYKSLAIWATIALLLMLAGAIGVNTVPQEYFGIPERFSVFSATGFNAVLGVYLYRGFSFRERKRNEYYAL